MKIILSPAKTMNSAPCDKYPITIPQFSDKTQEILCWLKSKSYEELKQLWACNDKLAQQNLSRIENMDLTSNLTPAVLTYDGAVYQHIAADELSEEEIDYLQKNLRILSAFYGALKAMDGITPYRLEMQAKASVGEFKNLYDFWGKDLYEAVRDESGIIINLASKEYSRYIEKYLAPGDKYITVTFCENSAGKLVTKGTYAKMARGEMVRFMAENKIENPSEIKKFDKLGFVFREDLSCDTEYVFERIPPVNKRL